MATLLLTLRGVIEASPDAVAEILLDARPGGRSPLTPQGTAQPDVGDVFTVTQPGSRITMEVHRATRMVARQGQWWYRGETSVEADRRGSLLTYRVFDVADSQRWAIRFVSRGPLRAAPVGFACQLHTLGELLSCPAYPLE